MNVMLKKAIDFAENLEGKATQDKIDELKSIILCISSEVENTAKSSHPENPYLFMKCDYEVMVFELLYKILFNKDKYNRNVECAINNLKS